MHWEQKEAGETCKGGGLKRAAWEKNKAVVGRVGRFGPRSFRIFSNCIDIFPNLI
jgi:hypothetical protein